ncbi:hypothetical protein V8C86DRAFT_3137942 [Haematococcus lacustris]
MAARPSMWRKRQELMGLCGQAASAAQATARGGGQPAPGTDTPQAAAQTRTSGGSPSPGAARPASQPPPPLLAPGPHTSQPAPPASSGPRARLASAAAGGVTDRELAWLQALLAGEARPPRPRGRRHHRVVRPVEDRHRAQHALMAAYCLAAWAWRSWEFAVALLLLHLYPSLLLVSVYGLVDNGVRLLSGPAVGAYIARRAKAAGTAAGPGGGAEEAVTERLPGIRAMFLVQNACIASSAAAAAALLWGGDSLSSTSWPQVYWPLMALLVGLGAASSIGSSGLRIGIENEAGSGSSSSSSPPGSQGGALPRPSPRHLEAAGLNIMPGRGSFRAIDLSCLLLAPLGVGCALTALGPLPTTALLAGYSLVAAPPELSLLLRALHCSAALRAPKLGAPLLAAPTLPDPPPTPPDLECPRRVSSSRDSSELRAALLDPDSSPSTHSSPPCHGLDGWGAPVQLQPSPPPSPPRAPSPVAADRGGPEADPGGRLAALLAAAGPEGQGGAAGAGGLAVFARQPVALPQLALALLYCTVLSLGFLMTAYLQWTGLTAAEVSVYRGVGALTGLAATLVFPPAARHLGLEATGLLGCMLQLCCLLGGAVPYVTQLVYAEGGAEGALLPPSIGAVRLLVAGVVASRTGLWLFDLAVTQLVQQRVAGPALPLVCGVQASLCAGFETLSFLAGCWLPEPTQFPALVLASLACVAAAALLYCAWAMRTCCQRQGPAAGS